MCRSRSAQPRRASCSAAWRAAARSPFARGDGHRHPAFRQVRVHEAAGDGGVGDARIVPHQRFRVAHQVGVGAGGGEQGDGGRRQGQADEGAGEAHPAASASRSRSGALGGARGHVHMRVGAVGDKGVHALDQALADVAVQVVGAHHRHRRPDDAADQGGQGAVAVLVGRPPRTRRGWRCRRRRAAARRRGRARSRRGSPRTPPVRSDRRAARRRPAPAPGSKARSRPCGRRSPATRPEDG